MGVQHLATFFSVKRTLNTPLQVCLNHCHCSILYKNVEAVYKSNTVQGEIFTTDWNTSSGLDSGTIVSMVFHSKEVSSLCSSIWFSWHQRVTLTSLTPVLAVQASNTCICYEGGSSFCHGVLELSNSRHSKASLSRCGKQAMEEKCWQYCTELLTVWEGFQRTGAGALTKNEICLALLYWHN